MRPIDADKLIEEIESYRGDIFASEIVELIKQMPTIGEWIPVTENAYPKEKVGTNVHAMTEKMEGRYGQIIQLYVIYFGIQVGKNL